MEKNINNLKFIFEPKTVAVIGASKTPGKSGFNVLRNLKSMFKGKIYAVNPNAEEILGFKVYRNVKDIPDEIDTVVIATPAKVVVEVMKDCAEKGVKAAVIVSSGFSEEGEEGRKLQEELVSIIRKHGIRVAGPNTMGVLNTANGFISSLVPFRENDVIPVGNVAFIAQTGLFSGAMLYRFASMKLGISKVAGLGNKIDVTDVEVLEYLAEDEQTKVIAMYIEGIKDGRRFIDVARKVTRKKPVIVLKGGITEAGVKTVVSHTASLTGKLEVFEAACKQAGVLLVHNFDELLDVVKGFAYLPIPKGNRVALAHFTGAGCVMGADTCVKGGLRLAEFTPKTIQTVKEVTPEWHGIRNPLDSWPMIERYGTKVYDVILKAMLEDENVDAVIFCFFATQHYRDIPNLDSLKPKGKPVLFCIEGDVKVALELTEIMEAKGFPVYPFVEKASFVLSYLNKYRENSFSVRIA